MILSTAFMRDPAILSLYYTQDLQIPGASVTYVSFTAEKRVYVTATEVVTQSRRGELTVCQASSTTAC